MNDKKIKVLVIISALVLLVAGSCLFLIFDKQGISKNKSNNYVNYNVNDYVELTPVIFNDYDDVYSSINVSRVNIKKIDYDIAIQFINKQEEFIDYISGYYREISAISGHIPANTVSSSVKTQINGAVLSIFYRLDFNLDSNIFEDNIKSYIVTINIDLRTNKILTPDDLLSKFDYDRSYIVDKLFNEEILIDKSQVVIDKNTNISLTRGDIERKKGEYVDRIISEFDNIIDMYIENNSLVLVYNSSELKNLFFDNHFETNIKLKYLK